MNVEDVKLILSESINQFKDKDPEKYSYKFLSLKSGVSPSFVERAAKNKLGEPLDIKKVMQLADYVCSINDRKILANYFVSGFFANNSLILKEALLKQFEEHKLQESEETIDKVLQEEEVFIAYALSASSLGTTEEKVRRVMGEAGVLGLRKLLDLGVVSFKDDKYSAVEGQAIYKYETIKRQLGILARLYKPSNVGKKRNYVHIMTEGLNEDGVSAWQEEHKKHQNQLRKIKNDFKGPIDVFSVGFMDVFLPDDNL